MKKFLYSVLMVFGLTTALTVHASPPLAAASAPDPEASAAAASVAPATPISAPSTTKQATAVEELPLKIGMEYWKARKLLLAQGWWPVRDPNCLLNTLGGESEKENEEYCSTRHKKKYEDDEDDEDDDYCLLCRRLPELSTCSVDGACNMYFRKKVRLIKSKGKFINIENKLLKITVYSPNGVSIHSHKYFAIPAKVTGWNFHCHREAGYIGAADFRYNHYNIY